jgi:hypothetical protein
MVRIYDINDIPIREGDYCKTKFGVINPIKIRCGTLTLVKENGIMIGSNIVEGSETFCFFRSGELEIVSKDEYLRQ